MAELWTPESLRAFEEEVRDIYISGRIRAPVHLSRGNEKPLIEIFKDVGPLDWVFSTYRSHYHALLKGIPRDLVLAEILAGNSIHLTFPQYDFYSSAIVAGCLPIALGTALGIKRRGGTEKVWCFIGDMATHMGAYHEALTYAYEFRLPMWFVTECNGFSTNTPTDEVWNTIHDHIRGTIVAPNVTDWLGGGGMVSYCYKREWPHYGVGVFVNFDQAEPVAAQERPDVMG